MRSRRREPRRRREGLRLRAARQRGLRKPAQEPESGALSRVCAPGVSEQVNAGRGTPLLAAAPPLECRAAEPPPGGGVTMCHRPAWLVSNLDSLLLEPSSVDAVASLRKQFGERQRPGEIGANREVARVAEMPVGVGGVRCHITFVLLLHPAGEAPAIEGPRAPLQHSQRRSSSSLPSGPAPSFQARLRRLQHSASKEKERGGRG
jgi:hypothetical protein